MNKNVIPLKITKGINFLPNLDMVSTTVTRKLSFPPILTFLRHCNLAHMNNFLQVHTIQEHGKNCMCLHPQHMETSPILHHLPPQYLFDAETALPQFISADHKDAFPTDSESPYQHWTACDWASNITV